MATVAAVATTEATVAAAVAPRLYRLADLQLAVLAGSSRVSITLFAAVFSVLCPRHALCHKMLQLPHRRAAAVAVTAIWFFFSKLI